jgi:hypothetical protein
VFSRYTSIVFVILLSTSTQKNAAMMPMTPNPRDVRAISL